MRTFLIFISLFFSAAAYSQTLESIEKLVYRIDNTKYTDSISIVPVGRSLVNPSKIIAFLSGDTLLKTKAIFKDSARIRLTYYCCSNNWTNKPCYVKEFDSVTNSQLTEIYGYDHTVLKSDIRTPLEKVELQYPERLLEDADYSNDIAFALVDRKAEKYHFKVKLSKALSLPPGCGYIAFALLQKFEVLSTDFPGYDNKFVLLIQPCPEFLGNKFFKSGKIYDVDVATNSGVTFGYSYINSYQKEKLPIFWNRKIVKVN